MERMQEKRTRTIEGKVKVCLYGLDNSPAGCNAITTNPNLRWSRGSGPRTTRRNSDSEEHQQTFQCVQH